MNPSSSRSKPLRYYSYFYFMVATATLILHSQQNLVHRSIVTGLSFANNHAAEATTNHHSNNTSENNASYDERNKNIPTSTTYQQLHQPEPSFLSSPPRPVKWLSGNDFAALAQAYSGMWWSSRDSFVKVEWSAYFKQLEAASFKMFRKFPVHKTVDWIDFSVTHLSVFWKHFQKKKTHHDVVAFRVIEQHLQDYMAQTRPLPMYPDSPAPYTIAVLPYLAPLPHADHRLPEEALRATLLSLWQMGIGRCVVAVGGRPQQLNETEHVEAIFASLHDKLQLRVMELQVISMEHVDTKFLPKTALERLQTAMLTQTMADEWQSMQTRAKNNDTRAQEKLQVARRKHTHADQWLGTKNASKWEFVYFTEPDLILHARPSAMPAFAALLRQGKSISAHRFQPLPHEGNFPLYNRTDKVLPHDFTTELWSLNPLNDSMACCDQGKWYASNPSMNHSVPLKNNRACGEGIAEFWWQCGFRKEPHRYHNLSTIQELHRHIIDYPFLYIEGGTGFPVLDLHQRTCRRQTKNCFEDETIVTENE